LPWSVKTEERIDLDEAEKILEEDHYGLEKVKERILEYLAVRKMKDSLKGPILCLVGPPGVGKTSIARSVAKALNRNYVRMSLGGVKDESEIRGHRKTYVGAMCGRLITAMKQAGSNNPMILLDEIDKMSSDFKGDPAAAMLEVLDAEQNNTFRDHYLELPFDLSDVMFLTTANSVDSIPRPLLDRMEIIEVTSYTEEEKVQIASKYLLPKQLEVHGLNPEKVIVEEDALRDVINCYTAEAGVRNLERELAKLSRKIARQLAAGKKKSFIVTAANLEKLLGIKKRLPDKLSDKDEVGIANGLAWTSIGGVTLSIEVNVMPGTGRLELTGSLGDVMKESALAAMSFIRSRIKEFGLDKDFYSTNDIHIHIPEGATPKDGPSAGITLATAMVSALTGIPCKRSVAMTGEITLRGRVLPIGGLKEKVLAAHRAGIKVIILPEDNKKDLEDIPANVRKVMKFVTVTYMDIVLSTALRNFKPVKKELIVPAQDNKSDIIVTDIM
jgi:ATP-dependent Lon protease